MDEKRGIYRTYKFLYWVTSISKWPVFHSTDGITPDENYSTGNKHLSPYEQLRCVMLAYTIVFSAQPAQTIPPGIWA